MMEPTRRFFLSGAVSLLAASTFIPSVQRQKNLPQIWGDGGHDDTSGLGALFRRDPVWFAPDKIGVDGHGGVIFHSGRFRVTQTVKVPDAAHIKVERITMDVLDLDESFYALRGTARAIKPFTGLFTTWIAWSPREERGVRDRRRFIETLSTDETDRRWAEQLGYDVMTDTVA